MYVYSTQPGHRAKLSISIKDKPNKLVSIALDKLVLVLLEPGAVLKWV